MSEEEHETEAQEDDPNVPFDKEETYAYYKQFADCMQEEFHKRFDLRSSKIS